MTPPQSSSAQHTWRLRDPRETRAKSKRRRFAIWLTLFLLLLLCVAAYLYVNWDHRRTYAGVVVTRHDLFAVPYIAFQERDERGWQGLIANQGGGFRALGNAAGLESAANQFADAGAGSRDAALLYVSTHGITHEGEAYLTESRFLRRDSGELADGLYRVEDLLRRLAESQAGIKLLLLDAGRIAYDPRLGVVLNSFPSRLEQVVAETLKDDQLWVLLSHSTGQISGGDSAAGRSLFGQSVMAALEGEADRCGGDGDGNVTLDELYQYVWTDITRWKVNQQPLQTPLLLRGGRGRVGLQQARGCDIVLARVVPEEPDEDKTEPAEKEKSAGEGSDKATARRSWPHAWGLALAGAAPKDQPDTPADGSKPAAKQPGKDTGDSAQQPKTAAGTAEGPKPVPSTAKKTASKGPESEPEKKAEQNVPATKKEARTGPAETSPGTVLQRIWEQRDQLINARPGGWSPVDFAPSTWRRLEALLVGNEARLRAGLSAKDTDLALVLSDLKALTQEIEEGRPGSYKTQPVNRIVDDWREFAGSDQREVLEQPEMRTLTSAWQLRNRVSYELPSFVRWQALTVFSAEQLSCSDELRRATIEHLGGLNEILDSVETSLTAEMEERIQERHRELAATYEQLRKELRMAWGRAGETEPGPIADRLADTLLATPLLNAQQRSQLVAPRATKPVPRPPGVEIPTEASPAPPWEAVRQLVEWEVNYLRLCDPSTESLHVPALLDRSTAREVGSELLGYYEGVPDALRASGNSALVWLVDPRDQPRAFLAVRRPALPSAGPPPIPVELKIVEVPDSVRLSRGKKVELPVAFAAQGLQDNRVVVHVRYDVERLVVRKSENGEMLSAEASFELPLDADPTHQLVLSVESTRLAESPAETAAIEVQLAGVNPNGQALKTEPWQFTCQMPIPPDVDLWTVRYNDEPEAPQFAQGIRIKPYPNRVTPFTLWLSNQSQVQKTVKVELYGVPDPREVASLVPNWAPGRLFVSGELRDEVPRLALQENGQRNMRPSVRRLAAAVVELPADGAVRRPIVFKPPGALAPKPAVDEATKPSKTPAAPGPPPPSGAIDVSHGMVMTATNVDDPADRVVKWIGILPLHPSRYLELGEVRYENRRVRATLQLIEPRSVPAVRDNPVEVVWANLDAERFLQRSSMAKLSDEPGRGAGELWAQIPPEVSDCRLELNVDGYPRAFVYEIRCEENEIGRSLADKQLAIRIVGVTPVYENDTEAGEGDNAPPLEIPVAAAAEGPTRLPIRSDPGNPCTDLIVHFEVDAPENAFESINPLARVRLGNHLLFCDRQVQTTLEKLGPDGALHLLSKVSDYRIPVKVEGKTSVVIRAELQKRGEEGTSSQVMAVLDGIAPRVLDLDNLPAKIQAKTPLTLDVEFTDDGLSGMQRLVVAVDVNESGTIDDPDIQKSFKLAHDARQMSVELPTDKLEPNSGGYRVLAQVTDRVGMTSSVRESETVVRIDVARKPPPAKAEKGSICGTVFVNNRPARLTMGTVTIKELPRVVDVDGATFRFDEVPMGNYTLEASGNLSGYPYATDPDAPVKATPKPPAEADFGDYRLNLIRPKPGGTN